MKAQNSFIQRPDHGGFVTTPTFGDPAREGEALKLTGVIEKGPTYPGSPYQADFIRTACGDRFEILRGGAAKKVELNPGDRVTIDGSYTAPVMTTGPLWGNHRQAVSTESIVKAFPSVPNHVIDGVLRSFADRNRGTPMTAAPDLSEARKVSYPYPDGFNNHAARSLYFVQTGPAEGRLYLNTYSSWNPDNVIDQWTDLGRVGLPMASPQLGRPGFFGQTPDSTDQFVRG